jgi:very-short-patch-repair endonuclease
VSVEELCVRVAAHAQSQRDALAERLSRQVGWSSSLVLCALKDGEEELLGWVSADSSTALAELWAALPSGLPALLARAPENAGSGWFGEAASSLIQIAEAVPRAELAMAATEEDICSWQRGAQPRERSLLGEGLIQLEPGPGVAKHAPRVVSAQAFPALAAAPRLYYDEADLARSRAERTLYRELEGRPRTRGLFALNGRLAAPFGPAPLEVDLLSEALSIAVEIDGYHHFRDASAYRRDRDKDVLLQRLGYTVVRVLAIDVDAQLGYVLDTIDRVVDHEKQKRSR